MISRLNNNNFFRSVDEPSSEQQSAKSTQAESAKPVLITEVGFPKIATACNSSASPELTSIAVDGKNFMNMRAGLLQKSLNDALSDATATNIKMPTSIEFPNLKAEEKKP